jgi:hypothetical protein
MSLRSWARSTLHTLHSTYETPRAAGRAGRRRSRRDVPHRRGHLTEALESRLLLTTLRGGDTFEYLDASNEIVRIRLQGNITAEIVGASVSGLTNEAEAANLPGNLNGTDILGGIGGPGGIDIIGAVGGLTIDPDINALAANSSGEMYAFELQEVPIPNPPQGGPQTRKLVNLVQLTFQPIPQPPDPAQPLPPPYGPRREVAVTATRLFEISDEIVAESGGVFSAVNTVPAADFNPANGLLYFVATGGQAGQQGQNQNFDRLFTVNVTSGAVNGIAGNFNDTGGQGGITVASLAFDQTAGGPQLVALIGEDQGGAGGGGGGGAGGGNTVVGATNPYIAVVSQTNTDNFLSQAALTLVTPGQGGGGNQQVPALSGIEILNEDPTRVDDLLAVGPGASFQIVRTGNNVGTTLRLGALAEPIPPGLNPPQDPTGGSPSSLMFVPGMLDPFTNTLGAYVAFDTQQDSNKLFWVNRFEQRPVTIYQVYVASSDVTGSIAISRVPDLTTSPRPMTPFDGDSGQVRHIDAQNPATFPWPTSNAPNTGRVFIGAKTRDLNQADPNDDLRPILTATIPPTVNLGLLPVGNLPIDQATGRHIVGAGITINGDMDRLMIGGTVTGDVIVGVPDSNGKVTGGSLNQFYCGWLLTGDAVGEVQGAGPTRPQNFRVFGDLRDLYVADSIGTDNAQANADAPTYVTGFDLRVGGTVGNVRTGDMWLGNFQVANRPEEDATRGIDIPDTEIETHSGNLTDPGPWDNFNFGQSTFFFNDTFDTPQYLGAINSLGQSDMARVQGTVQHVTANGVNDFVDYYAVSLMAGQSVTVQLFTQIPGLAYVGVFDPDQRLVGTDSSDVGTTGFGQAFNITADRPGTYRFAVSLPLNFGFFNQAADPSNIAVP